jgi:hypothetical protein
MILVTKPKQNMVNGKATESLFNRTNKKRDLTQEKD